MSQAGNLSIWLRSMDSNLEARGAVQLWTNTSVGKQVELQLGKTLPCLLALGLVRAGMSLPHIHPDLCV